MTDALLRIVDDALNSWVDKGLNCHPSEIPSAMATGEVRNDWQYWKPIPAKVTDEELTELQSKLGVVFPPSYIDLLKHRHFIELHVCEVSFFSHPVGDWKRSILEVVLIGSAKEFLLDRGYLPFADYSDWGLWCFALNEQNLAGEYPVYQWAYEAPEKHSYVAENLTTALLEHAGKNNA